MSRVFDQNKCSQCHIKTVRREASRPKHRKHGIFQEHKLQMLSEYKHAQFLISWQKVFQLKDNFAWK